MPRRNSQKNQALDELQGAELVQRVSLGQTLHKASLDLKIEHHRAQKVYQEALSAMVSTATKQEMIQQELNTLAVMQRGLMQKAAKGDPQAVRIMLHLMDRRSRYLGLDESIKVQLEVANINNAVKEVVNVLEGELAPVEPLRRITKSA